MSYSVLFFFFNWRIIVTQCCIGFYHTSAWISHIYVCYAVLSHSVVSDSATPPGSSVHSNSPGKNIRVGFHAFLQVIFPTQGLNQGLLHCRQILNHLSHQGSSRILEWVVYPFSRGSSLPGNQIRVSCIAGGFFTSWATREACIYVYLSHILFLMVISFF